MKLDVVAIKKECKAWLKERGYPETKPDDFVMQHLVELYNHLLTKGLVTTDREMEEAFYRAAEEKFMIKKVMGF